jgi:hypothetical protein
MAIVPKPSEIPNHQLSFKPATAHHQKSKFEFQHIESINSKPIITYSAFFVHFLIKKNDRWE